VRKEPGAPEPIRVPQPRQFGSLRGVLRTVTGPEQGTHFARATLGDNEPGRGLLPHMPLQNGSRGSTHRIEAGGKGSALEGKRNWRGLQELRQEKEESIGGQHAY
jgi:hypothetical protein